VHDPKTLQKIVVNLDHPRHTSLLRYIIVEEQ